MQNQDRLHEAFISFVTYGTRQPDNMMDGARFVKLCKDCGIIGKGFTVTDADLIFSKVKPKGARKITFEQFLEALRQIATRKDLELAYVEELVLGSPGPTTQATQPDYVKFHDDKHTFTGMYAKRGG